MKKASFITSIIVIGLLVTPISGSAQLLKSLGKALEKAGKGIIENTQIQYKSQQQTTASVNFSNLRLTYDQVDANNGRKMLQVHYNLTATGMQGHTLIPVLAIEIPQGTWHKFADGKEMKAEGNHLICNYQTTIFNGQWQAIYIDALNPLPGKRTYYARIYLVDMTLGKQIAASNYLTFTNTGEQQSTQQQPKPQPKPQQQAEQQAQQQKKSSNHLTFQGIQMGQPGENIRAALKQKGFIKAEESLYGLKGTLNGVSVMVGVPDDGSTIAVTEELSNTKTVARKRFLQIKTQLMETYRGKVYPKWMWDGGDGAVISTDNGYVEVYYRDADEVNFSGNEYLLEYIYKDKACMTSKDIAIESSYTEGDAISAETAIELYKSNDESLSKDILVHLGYFNAGEDSKGYTYWCRNCDLTKTLKPTAFGKGTSSVVRFRFKGQPDVRVQVFNENATQSYYDQLERLGYGWQGTGTGTGALEWKKDMTDQNEKSFWLISSKGYFYEQHGGYFLILGGNID